MELFNEGFVLFILAVVITILVSIQFTLNKILRALNEIKSRKE